jgi:hypothetical protein
MKIDEKLKVCITLLFSCNLIYKKFLSLAPIYNQTSIITKSLNIHLEHARHPTPDYKLFPPQKGKDSQYLIINNVSCTTFVHILYNNAM